MATVPCACPSKECGADPHRGLEQCSSTMDDAAIVTESDSDGGELVGPRRCEPCYRATSTAIGM